MSRKSTSSGSINRLVTNSWNHLQYQLLASQPIEKSLWTAPLLYECRFNKSCCPDGWRFWHATMNSQWTHTFLLACRHLGTSINKFHLLQHTFFYILFFSSTESIIQILSTILNVVLLLIQEFFLQNEQWFFPVMNTLPKYHKWILFVQHNTFLAYTIHPMMMICNMTDSPFQSADKRRPGVLAPIIKPAPVSDTWGHNSRHSL